MNNGREKFWSTGASDKKKHSRSTEGQTLNQENTLTTEGGGLGGPLGEG